MSYTSLYRKYRPIRFADVKGQPHVVGSAMGAIKQQKISHAYLFAGPRGTGKTSLARLFVRAINCTNPQDFEPCNECEVCKNFLSDRSLDLLEIDAASNRGIDEIRSLREKVQFAATGAKYKAFIIDEVHMLTKEAFNALLKTLEEPPQNTVFILATTEIHKLPETIISRCQRFDFTRITDSEIFEHLKWVLNQEKIEFEEEALKSIAVAARGGMRDALSLMDQLVSVGGKLTFDRVLGFLGVVSEGVVLKILENLVNGKTKDIFSEFKDLSERGVHWPNLTSQIISALRAVLLACFGQFSESWSVGEKESIEGLAKTQAVGFWQKALEAFLEADNNLKLSPIPSLCLEMAIIKSVGQNQKDEPVIIEQKKEVIKEVISQSNESKDILNDAKTHWGEIQLKSKQSSASVYSLLRLAELVDGKNGTITLSFPTRFHAERASERKNLVLVEKLFCEVLGSEVRLECIIGGAKADDDMLKAAKDVLLSDGPVGGFEEEVKNA